MLCDVCILIVVVFFFKQKTAYEMRISDWSSDVCSSDLIVAWNDSPAIGCGMRSAEIHRKTAETSIDVELHLDGTGEYEVSTGIGFLDHMLEQLSRHSLIDLKVKAVGDRSEEHTSELQSLMRISYAVFCLKTKQRQQHKSTHK